MVASASSRRRNASRRSSSLVRRRSGQVPCRRDAIYLSKTRVSRFGDEGGGLKWRRRQMLDRVNFVFFEDGVIKETTLFSFFSREKHVARRWTSGYHCFIAVASKRDRISSTLRFSFSISFSSSSFQNELMLWIYFLNLSFEIRRILIDDWVRQKSRLRFHSVRIDPTLIFLSPSFSSLSRPPISPPNLCIISGEGGQQPLPASIFSAEKFLKIFLEVYLLRVLITRNSRLFSLAKPFQGFLAPFHFLFSLPSVLLEEEGESGW